MSAKVQLTEAEVLALRSLLARIAARSINPLRFFIREHGLDLADEDWHRWIAEKYGRFTLDQEKFSRLEKTWNSRR